MKPSSLINILTNEYRHVVCTSRCYSNAPVGATIQTLPAHARVVICGAGVVGNSVAYHLNTNGWTDVVVLEKGKIGGGTSWLGAGLVGQFRTAAEQHLTTQSAALYRSLQEQGHDVGWKQCGSLNVAKTRDRWISLRRYAAQTRAAGIECEPVDPEQMKKIHPHLTTDDLHGGVWLPSDGVASPLEVCNTLAKLAVAAGTEYIENCSVLNLHTEDGVVSAVETDLGIIGCEYFVNCSGLWARELGLKSEPKVRVPVHAAEHFYITTAPPPTEKLDPMLAVMRDYDNHIYCREWQGGFLGGGFEPHAKPAFYSGIPDNFQFKTLPEDWDHFQPLLRNLQVRLPILNKANIDKLHNGPENFTPDGKPIMGEAPEVKNYYVVVGMNGNSIQFAGGIGKAVAEWIIQGESTADYSLFDIKRFLELHNNKRFLMERVKEIVGRHYTLTYPMQSEFSTARKLRCSPLYLEHEAAGAVFGEKMGFERPLYFNTTRRATASTVPAMMSPGTFRKPGWFEFIKEEYQTCREGVGVLDLSSMAKFEIKSSGTEVLDYMQLLCSSDVNVPPGCMVQTGMQNERGGFESECMVARKSDNCFFMVSPTIQYTRLGEWLKRHLPMDGSVSITDITSMYTVLQLIGPKSKELMIELTSSDMAMSGFTYSEVNIGYASEIMTMGFTNTGEPGYTMYVPAEYALHIFDRIMSVGRDYGIRNVGYFTLRALRVEKFIPFWGEELNSVTTPYEVGRGYKVKLEKEYFLGKPALMKQKEEGVKRRLVHLVFEGHDEDIDVWPWGREPIFRNSKHVGTTSSAGYGYTVGKVMAMGFMYHKDNDGQPQIVTNDYINDKDAYYEVDLAGRRFPVKVSIHPPKIPVISLDMHTNYVPKARPPAPLKMKK